MNATAIITIHICDDTIIGLTLAGENSNGLILDPPYKTNDPAVTQAADNLMATIASLYNHPYAIYEQRPGQTAAKVATRTNRIEALELMNRRAQTAPPGTRLKIIQRANLVATHTVPAAHPAPKFSPPISEEVEFEWE